MKFLNIFLTSLFCLVSTTNNAQELDANNRLTIALSDGTKVNLVGKAMPMNSETVSNDYYYLPTNLRIAQKPDGTPAFLFVKFTTEKDAASGGVQGAIIHFLMEWGLTDAQRKEADKKLKETLVSSNVDTLIAMKSLLGGIIVT